MAISQYYVRPTNGADVAGQGTTHATAYKTIQFALDDIGTTHGRNAVDGDQVNLCATTSEGADTLAASLTLATYGTPAAGAPLILRGYTAAANDGGVGEIDCGGNTMWAAGYSYIVLADLECHTFGDNNGIGLNNYIIVFRCEIHKGASAPAGKFLLSINAYSILVGNYLHGDGTGNSRAISTGGPYTAGNYIVLDSNLQSPIGIYSTNQGGIIENNIVVCNGVNTAGIYYSHYSVARANICYNRQASTQIGISATGLHSSVENNIICGWSGAGGKGIARTGDLFRAGYNAFWNNTVNYSVSDQIWIDERANDVTLAADPFTDAANGDFSLTAAAQAALRDVGWPAQFPGAHANTDGHITIGPIQYGPTAGGYTPKALRFGLKGIK